MKFVKSAEPQQVASVWSKHITFNSVKKSCQPRDIAREPRPGHPNFVQAPLRHLKARLVTKRVKSALFEADRKSECPKYYE
jgi:hypothetical protein